MSEWTEPDFAADFSARVLREADRIAARRRTARRAGGVAAVAGACLAAIVWVVVKPEPRPAIEAARPLPSLRLEAAGGAGEEPDALDEFFPDAKPVMRFDSRYDSAGDNTENLLSDGTGSGDSVNN